MKSILGRCVEATSRVPGRRATGCGIPARQAAARVAAGRLQVDAVDRQGVEEIRLWDDAGTFRVIYTARLKEEVVVLHAFQKKTQATSRQDIELAKRRWAQLIEEQ